jgi:hypothetical protein
LLPVMASALYAAVSNGLPDSALNPISAEKKDMKRQPEKVTRSKNHFYQRVALHSPPHS